MSIQDMRPWPNLGVNLPAGAAVAVACAHAMEMARAIQSAAPAVTANPPDQPATGQESTDNQVPTGTEPAAG